MTKRICEVDGCGNTKVIAKGLCGKHYQRMRKHGHTNETPRTKYVGCKVEGCDKAHSGLGWCSAHYTRWRRHGHAIGGGIGKDAAINFIKHVLASEPTDECIDWPYGTYTNGYGTLQVDNIRYPAHRYVLMQVSPRDDYDGMDAAHAPIICHNKICINPRHLRWATRSENLADTKLDGTNLVGERSHFSKLTENDVLEIRVDNRPQPQIAKDYGITQSNVSAIKLRKSWGHLP